MEEEEKEQHRPRARSLARRSESEKVIGINEDDDMLERKELIKKQQEKKRRRQAKRNQMSRKEFIEWCRAQDRSLKMIWIDEENEKDEQDSWAEVSRQKAGLNKQSIGQRNAFAKPRLDGNVSFDPSRHSYS